MGENIKKEIKFATVKYKFGNFFICKMGSEVVWAEFERKNSSPLSELLKMGFILKEDEAFLKEEISMLQGYFCGEKIDLSKIHVSFIIGTEKEKKIWSELLKIHYGETVTYSQLARRVGLPNAPRFVGNAVGKNPVPIIIPCHRVIRKDGTLGGFSAGLHVKKYLLELEGLGKFKK